MKKKYCQKHKTFSKKCKYCTYEEKLKKLENPLDFDECPQCRKDFDGLKNNCSLCNNKLR